jgi:hypothetical protein
MVSILQNHPLQLFIQSTSAISLGLIWSVIAFFVGKAYIQAIQESKVIGKKDDDLQ